MSKFWKWRVGLRRDLIRTAHWLKLSKDRELSKRVVYLSREKSKNEIVHSVNNIRRKIGFDKWNDGSNFWGWRFAFGVIQGCSREYLRT